MHIRIDQPFDLEATLACGQGHRWLSAGRGWYEGVLGENLVRIREVDDGIEFLIAANTTTTTDVELQLRRQFRLYDPIEAIYDELSRDDPVMANLVRKFRGLRVMRIDPWECLVFFILSANLSIDRIQCSMERIAAEFRVGPLLGDGTRYAFPKPSDLCKGDALKKLNSLELGLDKDRKIYEAACAVHRKQLDLKTLRNVAYTQEVIKNLRKLNGVDYKIAHCEALFALDKLDAFPIDRRIHRTMDRLYGHELGYPRVKAPAAGLRKWCQSKFGIYAGYASQFLFVESRCPVASRAGAWR